MTLIAAALLVVWASTGGDTPVLRTADGPCVLDGIAWSDAQRERLPGSLSEASGLALFEDSLLLAHDDERGIVTMIDADTGDRVGRFELGPDQPRDDFEGIALLNGRLYLLTSEGLLYETRVGQDGATVPFTVIDTGLGASCEFEGLAADATSNVLLLGCKTPYTGDLRDHVTVFAWSIERGASQGARVSAPVAAVRADGEDTFRPSAVELLENGDLLVLSGADRSIAVITPPDMVRCTRRLGSGHPQAEGLAVLRDGSIVIADEGDPARLTFYRRRGG